MMTNIKLSPRLRIIASCVPRGEVLVDVGCDHGWLGLSLLADGTIPKLIGMDLREGPLSGARQHAEETGFLDRAEFRLSDGLCAYRAGEASTLVIAGMGGEIMSHILNREPVKTSSFRWIIAEPQKDHELVRRAIRENGFTIEEEQMTVECGKFYPIIRAVKKTEEENSLSGAEMPESIDAAEQRIEDKYGPILIKRRDPILKEYLLFRYELLRKMLMHTEMAEEEAAKEKRIQFKQDLGDVKRLFSLYNISIE